MMKKHIHFLVLWSNFLLLVCSGCGSDTIVEPGALPEEVQLSVSVSSNIDTKVNLAGTAFDAGDTFRFFFNSDQPTNSTLTTAGDDDELKVTDYTFNNIGWETDLPIFWDDHKIITERVFCAVLPFGEAYDTSAHSFSTQSDQTALTDYKKSDLLLARVKTDARRIPLTFWHVMSKVIVNVTASTDNTNGDAFLLTDLTDMKVSLHSALVGTIDYKAFGTEQSEGPNVEVNSSGEAATVGMYCLSAPAAVENANSITATYVAIVPPQSISVGSLLLQFLVESGSKTYNFKANYNFVFEQGKTTTLNILLTKRKVELDSEITISSWDSLELEDEHSIVLQK